MGKTCDDQGPDRGMWAAPRPLCGLPDGHGDDDHEAGVESGWVPPVRWSSKNKVVSLDERRARRR